MKLLEKLLDSKTKKKKEKDTDVFRKIRLAIPAQAASIAPPLGPALGQFGINIIDFCKQFNERSQSYDVDVVLNVVITMFRNKSFVFEIKQPTFCYMLYEYYNSELIAKLQNKTNEKEEDIFRTIMDYEFPDKCSLNQLYQIALIRSFISGEDIKKTAKMLKSSLRSMHINLVNEVAKS